MSLNIKLEKQKKQYNRVNDLYINKNLTIEQACIKVGICKQTYYTIKKKLNEQNGGQPKHDNEKYSLNFDSTKKISHVRDIFNVIDSKIKEAGITV